HKGPPNGVAGCPNGRGGPRTRRPTRGSGDGGKRAVGRASAWGASGNEQPAPPIAIAGAAIGPLHSAPARQRGHAPPQARRERLRRGGARGGGPKAAGLRRPHLAVFRG